MTEKSQSKGPVALKNVAAFLSMTMELVHREAHLPGIAVCHSPSGFGKSWASFVAQNRTNAVRVEVQDSWTRRTLLESILREFSQGFRKRVSIADLAQLCIECLGQDARRPLIIDEADRCIDKGMIELVRELHECSGAPVILIGEERLPAKLLPIERVHNRVLSWFAAQPCDFDDTALLAANFAPKVTIADELLEMIRSQSGGRARRIVVNLSQVGEFARNKGASKIDVAGWGAKKFYTGEPPLARAVEPFKRAKAA